MNKASNSWMERPHTHRGRWAVGMAAAFLVMFLINSFVFMPSSGDAPWRHAILPFYGMAMLLCGLASGILGWIAVLRDHERSWLVLLTLLPGLWVVFMLVGELLFPH